MTDRIAMRRWPDEGDDVEGHRLASNDNETLVADIDEDDVEGHRLSSNDNETLVIDEAGPTA